MERMKSMNKVEVVFVIDKSGSMNGLEHDTVGGFNQVRQQQQLLDGKVNVSTVLFNQERQVLLSHQPLGEVPEMTLTDYVPGGSTALVDALGYSIEHMIDWQKAKPIGERAEKILFVVIIDGEENSSCHFTSKELKLMVEKEQTLYGWEFIFLGANIDSWSLAGSLGFKKENVADYAYDRKGTEKVYGSVNRAMSAVRESKLSKEWAAEVRADYRKRRGND